MEAKKDIFLRVYLVYVFFALFGIAIIARAVKIQFWEGEYWKEKSETQTLDYREIEAVRGNIFAADGSLLATSIPNYEIRMDMKVSSLTDQLFNQKIDSLSLCLSDLFRDKSAYEYKSQLIKTRKAGDRFHLIKRKASPAFLFIR